MDAVSDSSGSVTETMTVETSAMSRTAVRIGISDRIMSSKCAPSYRLLARNLSLEISTLLRLLTI